MENSSDLEQVFEIFSAEGRLPVEKLGEALRSAGRNPTQAQLKGYESEKADANTDWIGYEEFQEITKRQREVEEAVDKRVLTESILFALRAFDREGSGWINRNELKGCKLTLPCYLLFTLRSDGASR